MSFETLLTPPERIDIEGRVEEVVLVVSGVHGSELSGKEVVDRLLTQLLRGSQPHYSVVIVPVLFRENDARAVAAMSARLTRQRVSPRDLEDSNTGRGTPAPGGVSPRLAPTGEYRDPNRQFPAVGRCARGTPPRLAAQGDQIESENVFLLDLIEQVRPVRIVTVHAKRHDADVKDGAVVRTWVRRVAPSAYARNMPGIFVDPPTDLAIDVVNVDPRALPPPGRDDALALEAARQVDQEWYDAVQRGELPTFYGDSFDEWVPGNWLRTHGVNPTARYAQSAGTQPGVSLGEWGSRAVTDPGCDAARRAGIPIFTIEVRRYYPASAYLTVLNLFTDPADPVRQALLREHHERELEITAHARAIKNVLLEPYP